MILPDRNPVKFPRSSGVLLHITSLPGPYGIGDIGPAARQFVDQLVTARQQYWQVLPLCPTGYGDSPYQGFSSFAGNTNLISLGELLNQGWLTEADLADQPQWDLAHVDYEHMIPFHDKLLGIAHERFATLATSSQQTEFHQWCADNASWLEDFVLFISLKELYGGKPWVDWTPGEAAREPAALDAARQSLSIRIDEHRFRQWLFFRQWLALKTYANTRGINLIGDIPIFVGHDSCDVWVNRELFDLDKNGQPNFIAGVPPDSFSATGQRWGNPLYLWDKHQATGYAWWIKRVDAAFALVDRVRIDHFRGFDRYWQIPAQDATAERGTWQPGPGRALFDALGEDRVSRIIAEDLGNDLGAAIDLRDELGLPGMIVLQFAFSGTEAERKRFDPRNPASNFIVYTGTHDNNTTVGWWNHDITELEKENVRALAKVVAITEPNWTLMQVGMSYHAHTFIVPMQDVLGLDERARMNTPSVPSGNWQWRCTAEQLQTADWNRLRGLTEQSNRIGSAG